MYNLDVEIEKANRLVELLREAQHIIDSLSCRKYPVSFQLNISDADGDDAVNNEELTKETASKEATFDAADLAFLIAAKDIKEKIHQISIP